MPARRRLATSTALAVVMLLAVVALARRSGTLGGGGSSTGPEPSSGLLDVIFTFGVALLALLMAATLWTMRPSTRFTQDRSFSLWPRLLAVAIVVGAVGLLLTQLDGLDLGGDRGPETAQTRGPPRLEPSPPSEQAEPAPYRPRMRWIPLLVVAGIAATGIAALALRRSHRAGIVGAQTSEGELVAELAAAVDDAFADLEAEPDPRRAVIAAYARMERALATHGLARQSFEAPLEYLARIAPSLSAARRLVFELTHLYERARFSAHEIDGEMKVDAIATLAALRDELRPAA